MLIAGGLLAAQKIIIQQGDIIHLEQEREYLYDQIAELRHNNMMLQRQIEEAKYGKKSEC